VLLRATAYKFMFVSLSSRSQLCASRVTVINQQVHVYTLPQGPGSQRGPGKAQAW